MRLLMPTAHPTLAQLFENAVMGNRRSDHVASRGGDQRWGRNFVPVREMVNLRRVDNAAVTTFPATA
jgi:hypothetical protein